jgi:hypothetical protein
MAKLLNEDFEFLHAAFQFRQLSDQCLGAQ